MTGVVAAEAMDDAKSHSDWGPSVNFSGKTRAVQQWTISERNLGSRFAAKLKSVFYSLSEKSQVG